MTVFLDQIEEQSDEALPSEHNRRLPEPDKNTMIVLASSTTN